MKFRRTPREAVSLNLTPLIDVVFLLLIFFMVSTTFEQKSQLNLELPQTQYGSPATSESLLHIQVSQQGVISLNGKPVEDLSQALDKEVRQAGRSPVVIVEADRQATHGRVTEVLDQLAAAGLNQIRIQTRHIPE